MHEHETDSQRDRYSIKDRVFRKSPWTGSALLIATIIGTGVILAAWKQSSIKEAEAAAARQPEPTEVVAAAVAAAREHRQTTTSIGTVLALRSIELRNELPLSLINK
jgi:membrane fusion protein (multidrug efflux system)